MKTTILLTMHGAPPNDFPGRELGEYFTLHMQMENNPQHMDETRRQRYQELDRRVRAWPRSAVNDPFFASSQEMAQWLEAETGHTTQVCFNEFCDPSLSAALRATVAEGARRVVVITPMMTRGGNHAEIDIPQEITRLRAEYPQVEIIYAWPFDPQDVTGLLTGQIRRFIKPAG